MSIEMLQDLHLLTRDGPLNAGDTATDDALALAIATGADHVAVVPCCQAEVARQLDRWRGGHPPRSRAEADPPANLPARRPDPDAQPDVVGSSPAPRPDA